MARGMVVSALHKVKCAVYPASAQSGSRVAARSPEHEPVARRIDRLHAVDPVYPCARIVHTGTAPEGNRIATFLPILAIILAAAWFVLWLHNRGLRRRDAAIRGLLDAADAVEQSLQECRERMQRLRSMLVVLPEEMSASADSALQADTKVQAGLRDLLAHRLWIQQHAASATSAELAAARGALEQSRSTLRTQLQRLASIAADLERAQADARSVKRPGTP